MMMMMFIEDFCSYVKVQRLKAKVEMFFISLPKENMKVQNSVKYPRILADTAYPGSAETALCDKACG